MRGNRRQTNQNRLKNIIIEYIKENIKRDAFSEYERVPFMRPLDKRRILKSYRINYFV